jgi:hypothetical protein
MLNVYNPLNKKCIVITAVIFRILNKIFHKSALLRDNDASIEALRGLGSPELFPVDFLNWDGICMTAGIKIIFNKGSNKHDNMLSLQVVYQPNEGDVNRIIFECAELPPITIAMHVFLKSDISCYTSLI